MAEPTKSEKVHAFFRELCVGFVGCLRALSLYPEDHPESRNKLNAFFQRLEKYLSQRPAITFLFLSGEMVVENVRLPELSATLAQIIQRFEKMKFQRLVFRHGLTPSELLLFLQIMLPLLKKPAGADLVIAKNQESLPHILAGTLPFETGPQVSYEEISSVLQTARQSVLSFSGQLKDLFADLEGPMSSAKVSAAMDTTDTILKMNRSGELPLKILIYRRSSDPDPFIHAINVCALSMAMASNLDMEPSAVRDIGVGALLHDIGLHLTTFISLSKTAAITLDEKKRQWEHPIRGAEVLLASPGIPDVAPLMAYEHHLHYDGTGYPEQEKPRDLNLAGMILAITDTYDILRRNRPEQEALSLTETLNWMDRRIGTHFHPLLFKQFRAMVKARAKEEI
ncbi:MAG: HD domain-containing protein [Deltaproteobacteria bacterium]|nr:HD domain-containing protein [Deltaproteobacteria bacterium]